MVDKSEVQRRKELLKAVEAKQRASQEAGLPVSKEILWALFDYLDESLSDGCDHSLRLTETFLISQEIQPELVVPWLGEYGGFCDCEVLFNVEEQWGKQ